MKPRAWFIALTLFMLAAAAVSAWMLVPLSGLPLASLTAAQGNRVVWGWALATLDVGLACLWLVLVVHALLRRGGHVAPPASREP